jgi:N-acetylglutamate synthase-like GNAT family acetyltransferase
MHAVWFETYALPVETKAGVITVRPLRNGDTATVQRVVERLGKRKKIVTARELESFARVDAHRHVLIAYAYGEPIAIAQLVRDVADPRSAEVASAVADGWQRLDVGAALTKLMTDDADAAGITHVRAAAHPAERADPLVVRYFV